MSLWQVPLRIRVPFARRSPCHPMQLYILFTKRSPHSVSLYSFSFINCQPDEWNAASIVILLWTGSRWLQELLTNFQATNTTRRLSRTISALCAAVRCSSSSHHSASRLSTLIRWMTSTRVVWSLKNGMARAEIIGEVEGGCGPSNEWCGISTVYAEFVRWQCMIRRDWSVQFYWKFDAKFDARVTI